MNNNFKTSLVIALNHFDALRTKNDMRLIPNLIPECTPNSKFSANH